MNLTHLGGGGQQFQYIFRAVGHHSQLGDIGAGAPHLLYSGDQFLLRRCAGEIVAGTDHLDPGGVCMLDQGGKCVSGGAQFQIQQIGAAAGA